VDGFKKAERKEDKGCEIQTEIKGIRRKSVRGRGCNVSAMEEHLHELDRVFNLCELSHVFNFLSRRSKDPFF